MQATYCAASTLAAPQPSEPLSGLLFPILGVIAVVFMAYAVTRWIAKKYRLDAVHKCVKVVERVPLGKDRDLVTVETDGQAYLLAVTGQNVTVVCSYDAKKLPQRPVVPASKFADVLDIVKKRGEMIKMPQIKAGRDRETWHP